ncbi:L-2-amino-thiazoline-4-carboxylic acid hydrolase [Ramlibacter sp.]|uniref:L-2-amino-thiazoline-4-carboxylic acid hydrolase n=1 Tax=Ramlibacter sp. TaxID=1917967 RepID=UPI003D1178C2
MNPSPTPHPYYAQRRDALVADFEECLARAAPKFAQLLPQHPLASLKPELIAEFDRVLATLPYAGGAQGRMTPFFEQATGFFAVGRVLRSHGVPIEVNGPLMRETFMARLVNLPESERHALGHRWLTPENQAALRELAAASQTRENPGDFVYRFVEAGKTESGAAFDFGIDYSECGFCKLSKANGDEDLLPVMCAMDNESYGLRGIKLYRTRTLAGGDTHCNFRFSAKAEAKS